MQVRTRHTPAFGVARLLLAPGEAVQADYAAMLATSYGVLVAPARGGSRGKARRAVFTAPAEGGWVDVAPALPGDVHTLELDGMAGWCVARGSWLAAAATVRADAQWPGFRGLFGADVGFLEHVSGDGAMVLACCGSLDVVAAGGRRAGHRRPQLPARLHRARPSAGCARSARSCRSRCAPARGCCWTSPGPASCSCRPATPGPWRPGWVGGGR